MSAERSATGRARGERAGAPPEQWYGLRKNTIFEAKIVEDVRNPYHCCRIDNNGTGFGHSAHRHGAHAHAHTARQRDAYATAYLTFLMRMMSQAAMSTITIATMNTTE